MTAAGWTWPASAWRRSTRSGDVNVSLFNGRLAGAGGFINISQNARELIFAGTFTTGGLKTAIVDGQLKILSEGKSSKFIDKIDQITFSGRLLRTTGSLSSM